MKAPACNHRLALWGGVLCYLLLAEGVHAVPTQLFFRSDGENVNLRLETTAPASAEAAQTLLAGPRDQCLVEDYPDTTGAKGIQIYRFVTPEGWSKDPGLNQVNFEFWGGLKTGGVSFAQLTLRVTIEDALDGATWIEQMGATCPGCKGSGCSGSDCTLNSAGCIVKFNREAGGNILTGSSVSGSMGALRITIAIGSTITVEVWNAAGSGEGSFYSDDTNVSWIKVPYAKDNFSIWGSISPQHVSSGVESTLNYVLDNTHAAAPDITQLDIEIPGGLPGSEFFQNVDRITVGHAFNSINVTQATGSADGTLSIDFSGSPVTKGEVVTISFTTTAPGTSIKTIKWDATANPATGNFSLSEKNPDSLYTAVFDLPADPTLTSVNAANTASGGGQIQITWDGPDPDQFGTTAYRVFRGLTAEGPMSLLATVPPDASPSTGPSSWRPVTTLVTQNIGLSFTDTPLTNGDLRCYAIKSVNPVGESGFSLALCATAYAAPGAPNSITALVANTRVELAWTPSVPGDPFGLDIYEIHRSTCSTCAFSLETTVSFSSSVYINTGLSDGTRYRYKVRALDTQGNPGAFSVEESGQPAVNPPAGLTALYDDVLSGVTLQWQTSIKNVFQLTAYNIFRSTCSTCALSMLNPPGTLFNAAATVYTDTTVSRAKLYFYAVSALSEEGGAPSFTEGAMTSTVKILTPPATPTALTVLPVAGLALYTEWSTLPNLQGEVGGYNVYRSTYPGTLPLDLVAIRSPQSTTSYPDSIGLALGQRYHYRVSAFYTLGGESSGSALSSTVYGVVEPDKPTGLTGQGANNVVRLSWADLRPGQEVDLYQIYRATTSTGGFVSLATFSGTYYDDTGVINGTAYFYQVSADNWGGEGLKASTLGIIPFDPPSTPGTLTVFSGPQQLLLEWGPSTPTTYPIEGYEVFRSAVSGAETYLTLVTGDTTSVYLDTSFTPPDNGTEFFYTVRARDNQGFTSLDSNEASAIPAIPPCPPSTLVALPSAALPSSTTVTLQWDIVDGALCSVPSTFPVTGYRVYRSTSPGAGYLPVATTINFDATSYIDTTVTDGITYYYAIRSFDDQTPPNESIGYTSPFPPDYSPEAETTPRVPAGPPFALTVLGEPYEHHGKLVVSWIASVPGSLPVVGYNVYRSITVGGAETLVFISGGSATAYRDSPLTELQFYYYRVVPVEEKGFLGNWAAVSGTPASDGHLENVPIPPSAPTITQLTPSDKQIDLCWDPPSVRGTFPVTTYEIYRSSGGVPQSTVFTVSWTVTCFTDTGSDLTPSGLSNGVTWAYQVRACDTDVPQNCGPWSNTTTGIPFQVPNPPTSLVTQSGNGQLTIAWAAAVPTTYPIAGYNLYRGTVSNGEGATPINASLVIGTTHVDMGLVNGVPYFYKIEAVDGNGHPSVLSAEVSGTPAAPPGQSLVFSVLPGNNMTMLSWSPASAGTFSISAYQIFRATCATCPGAFLKSIDVTVTRYTDVGLQDANWYYYRVRAVDTDLNAGMLTATRSGQPLTSIVNPPLDLVTLTDMVTGFVTLTWSPPEFTGSPTGGPVAEYVVLRADCTTCAYSTSFYVASSASVFTDTTITNGITYVYAVQSVNAALEVSSIISGRNVVVASTCLVPGAPGKFAAVAGDGAVTLSWQAPASTCPILMYHVYRSVNGGGFPPPSAPTASVTNLSYTDSGLVKGNTYQYQVRAENAAGKGPPATVAYAPNTVYLSQNVFAPLRGERVNVWYTLEKTADVTIGIYTVAGMLIYEYRQPNVPAGQTLEMAGPDGLPGWDGKTPDGRSVASGVYLIRIEAGDFKKLVKVIVLK